ncbi:MAG: helix-turn-helix domain-containing protein [bacterium]|nr:helix-turn-helix domain-containing protein [bacterium]
MGDTPTLDPNQDKLSPRLMEYLATRERRLAENIGIMTSKALESYRQTPEMRDKREIIDGMKELNRRIEALGRQVAAHIDQHASQARATAKYRPNGRGWPRGVDGRLEDPMLRALAHKKIDLGLTRQELADELGVNANTISHWLNRHWAPRGAEYDRVKKWVDEMEGVFETEFRAMRGLRK